MNIERIQRTRPQPKPDPIESITLTITAEEAQAFRCLIGYSNAETRRRSSVDSRGPITPRQDDLLRRMWNKIDDILA